MKYESCLFISTKDLKEYKRLLSIEDINNNDYGKVQDFIQVGAYTYDNGITLYIDLCSGDSNYFLQYELVDKNNNVVSEDTFDTLEDFEIKDNNDIYIVHFDLYEEENKEIEVLDYESK